MFASVRELDSRPSDEVGHRSGDQDLMCLCRTADPCGNVDGNARDVVVPLLYLSDVDSTTNGDTDLRDPIVDRLRAADGGGRAVKGGECAVADRFHEPSAE